MTKLNLGCGDNRLDGFVNLDAKDGWRFEDGLTYLAGTVEAITISHALMYLRRRHWPKLFKELSRVLESGGVLRVTEDATDDPHSERFGGHEDAVTLTTESNVREQMRKAGLAAQTVGADETAFRDNTLIQQFHGPSPKVFHVEGVKP